MIEIAHGKNFENFKYLLLVEAGLQWKLLPPVKLQTLYIQ